MGFALAATIVLSVTRRWSMITAAPVAAIVVLSLFFSQVIAALLWADIEYRWQLPVTYALLTALVAVAGWSARQPLTVIAVALLAVAAGFAGVWAAELPAQWFSAPPLVAAALLLVSRPLWQRLESAACARRMAADRGGSAGAVRPGRCAPSRRSLGRGRRLPRGRRALGGRCLAQQQRRHLRFALEIAIHHSPVGARGVRVARVRIPVDRRGLCAGSARAGRPGYRLGVRCGWPRYLGRPGRRNPSRSDAAVGDPARAAPRDQRLDPVSRRPLRGS